MATKKQKHEAALAKREVFLAKVKQDGLTALEYDRLKQARLREELIAFNRAYVAELEAKIVIAQRKKESPKSARQLANAFAKDLMVARGTDGN